MSDEPISQPQGLERPGLFPSPAAADHSKGRLFFAVALACYAVVDFRLLDWIPVGMDTGDFWHVFYASYAELFFHNDLAHWFPYGAFGQPNDFYNLLELTSTDYCTMLVGKLLHVRNAMPLFRLSLVADHVLFLFGIYLLSRSLFRRRSSVALCVIGSLSLLHGFQLNAPQVFRMVSWYPLILYFLVLFFRDRKPEALWASGVVFTFWCLGNSYLPPYMVLCLAPFVAVASWKHPSAWRSVFSLRPRNLACLAVCAASALLYLSMTRQIMAGIEVARDLRSTTGAVSLDSFLGSRDHSPFEMLLSLYRGDIFYVGLLPVACILWGLFRARSPAFAALMSSVVLLTWFSLGGLLSLTFFHYVPFFSRTRYLYLGYYLLRATLLLAAAAAWDVLVPSRKDRAVWAWTPVIVLFSIDLALYGERVILVGPAALNFFGLWQPVYLRLATYGLLAALAVVGATLSRRRPALFGERWKGVGFASRAAWVTTALLAALFVDVFFYTYHRGGEPWLIADRSSGPYRAGVVSPLPWQEERLEEPKGARQRGVLARPTYFHTYAYAHFDPCRPLLEVRSFGTATAKLLALRDENDPSLQTILGCRAPKLRLLSRAIYVKDETEAMAVVRSTPDLASVVILQLPSGAARPAQTVATNGESAGSVTVTDFSANALTASVRVDQPGGAWLIYADTYDPRWQAWVDDNPVTVVPAYVGLKAVRVPEGRSVVRMEFSGGASVGMNALALGGATCSLALLAFCAVCCVAGFPPRGSRAVILDSGGVSQ